MLRFIFLRFRLVVVKTVALSSFPLDKFFNKNYNDQSMSAAELN
jgi:hypothetical protein